MQPFNSGPVRQKMYEIWTDDTATLSDISFFEGLEKGELNREYIQSHWFEKHSSTHVFIPGQLHVVKTTINHFLLPWTIDNFPGISQWAIWRDPWEILSSLIRNDFIESWYSDAIVQVATTVKHSDLLAPHYKGMDKILSHPHLEAAYLIAVRSHFLFANINPDHIINYEQFKIDNLDGIKNFFQSFGLSPLDGVAFRDMNLIGEAFNPNRAARLGVLPEHHEAISSIFAPLLNLWNNLAE